jgi:hypothetical protein
MAAEIIDQSYRAALAARLSRDMRREGACVVWGGLRKQDGYGQLHFRTVYWKAHRAAWAAAHGPIPDDLHVLHRCDNPACIKPKHLFLGTHADNMADKVSKGRATGPKKLHQSKACELGSL